MYEEFKRELFHNVTQSEEARDKVVRLLESRMICADSESIRMIRLINFACTGREDMIITEDFLCVSWGEGELGSMKYWKLRPLYDRYIREGWQSVLPEIIVKLQEACEGDKASLWQGSYEQCRRQHIIRPLNYQYCRTELENCIFWKYGDIALVLYMIVYETAEDCMTMKVNRSMAEAWELSDEVLLTNALLNTRVKMPPRLFHGNDLRFGYGERDGIFIPEDGPVNVHINAYDETEGIQGYRLTTSKWINGSVALFYPYVKEYLAQMMQGDYFVGFTSVHEAVIHPARYKVINEMKAAIQHINAVFEEREMLTNRVYRYCRVKGMLIEV